MDRRRPEEGEGPCQGEGEVSKRTLARFKCCLRCKALLLSQANICPNCKSSEFTIDWSGIVIIFDPESSVIAKTLNLTKPGRYAIKCR
jgi:DNA-directed RNA polymerase subunit E"